jgi:hypothetical protein
VGLKDAGAAWHGESIGEQDKTRMNCRLGVVIKRALTGCQNRLSPGLHLSQFIDIIFTDI